MKAVPSSEPSPIEMLSPANFPPIGRGNLACELLQDGTEGRGKELLREEFVATTNEMI